MALRFSNGMLGVAVVAVALAAAIMGSWALSTEVNEVQVTNYNSIADISGLFEGTKAPEYINYNPSTNYTGYHTTDPQYFDGVEYGRSTLPNSYKLNLAPLATVSEDAYDLTTITGSTATFNIRLYVANNIAYQIGTPNSMKITDLMDEMVDSSNNPLSNYDEVIIKNISTVDWSDDYGDDQWITFVPNSWIGLNISSSADFRMPGNTDTPTGSYANYVFQTPVMACKYDIAAGMVQLYYDIDMTQSAGIYAPNEVWVAWGLDNWTYSLATTADIEANDFPDVAYMDPSKGVEVE